jgi:putative phosphoserine phosphatase/1-acylglycerol-3-phosphate O-acyltransferase
MFRRNAAIRCSEIVGRKGTAKRRRAGDPNDGDPTTDRDGSLIRMPTGGAVFVDLDRTLIRSASGPVFHQAMEQEGVLPHGRHLPGDGLMYGVYNVLGETVPFIGLARATAVVMRGRSAEGTRRAGKRAVEALTSLVQPRASEVLDEHRREGKRLVLATTSPVDLVLPLAESLGFDQVIATRYAERDGCYTGRLDGPFVWGLGKRAAVSAWAADNEAGLADSHAYSDSFFDLPLLCAVGHPHPVNADPRLMAVAVARRWPLESWDKPPGVPSLGGLEPYHLVRHLFRPEAFPYARFDLSGIEHIPTSGPVILAANHRSYFDVVAIGIVAARLGRPVRFMIKREVVDAPVVGPLATALGAIRVDRDGAGDGSGGSSDPMGAADAALRSGEVVIVLPQGTIPRGEKFFDPVLVGHTGTARLAKATGATVVPIGLWGTERVWPRSSRVPQVTALVHPPRVCVNVGRPVTLDQDDAAADTALLMQAIADLLPDEARVARIPTAEDLARTKPPA